MKEQLLALFTKGDARKGLEEADRKFAEWLKQLPSEYETIVVEALDQVVFGLANFCQQKSKILETEKKIMVEARLFDTEIESIEQMQRLSIHHLEYIESKWKSKYSNYALIEGGVAGLGHPVGLLLDFPALLTINMKMIQAISSTYGYSLRYPPEQILALKVLHAASLPHIYEEEAWEWLIDQYHTHQDDQLALYQAEQDTIIQPEWLQTLAKQWIKSAGLYGLRKMSKQKYSIVGALLGAGANYQFTNQVGQFATRFYQYRFEQEKTEDRRSTLLTVEEGEREDEY